ncbi:hypothetical protein OUZ56_009910 [Daphnia magna]|uniref:Tc1-like transposase DDE domain-containing protein n=1 Tax=Daphnia magna TaxID=35525 RepID=A0ABR0AH89_9CRUS|nr:hypothetical protein OUZ56_009910 [Daphnia magna]
MLLWCWVVMAGSRNSSKELIAYKVKHSLHFKDPENGAHTNQIEGLWNLAKKVFQIQTEAKKCLLDISQPLCCGPNGKEKMDLSYLCNMQLNCILMNLLQK